MTLSIDTALEYIRHQAAQQPSSSVMANGTLQMRSSLGDIITALCRHDAVGRVSSTDRAIVLAAIAKLNEDGVLAGELNGYPLIR